LLELLNNSFVFSIMIHVCRHELEMPVRLQRMIGVRMTIILFGPFRATPSHSLKCGRRMDKMLPIDQTVD